MYKLFLALLCTLTPLLHGGEKMPPKSRRTVARAGSDAGAGAGTGVIVVTNAPLTAPVGTAVGYLEGVCEAYWKKISGVKNEVWHLGEPIPFFGNLEIDRALRSYAFIMLRKKPDPSLTNVLIYDAYKQRESPHLLLLVEAFLQAA